MKPGDRVEVTHPKYEGCEGEITHLRGSFAKVDIGMGLPREFDLGWLRLLQNSDTVSDTRSDTNNGYNFPSKRDSPSPVSETISQSVSEIAPKKRPFKAWHTIYCYRSKGQRYYRYAWKDTRERGQLHIPGGSWRSPVVRERRDQVRKWISEGKSSSEIRGAISNWGW